ncbi:DeoR/GlpR family DNA-binding transcription regulator [Galbibacter sp. EGI 63066]|uniref:DeoR/GlpR family DNA-binding transcription regulator n=1 Tax=Galbibacter sp. EGI 63066 TaxID=2993559 RepID=UPI002248A16F|nr:DeoR/GlpR family DNA-binding transcription regulator [Galbibacter sp. EGI 63066]MCX2679263.1 DeoR/GlpR family DNA-binding transcription regulator [Galbibacter sp. EGI 63066]
MLKAERHQIILNEVRIHNRVLLVDIANLLKVSVDTIRRDVTELHKEKKLKKVHGGAISLGFNNYSIKKDEIYSLEKKSKIAEKGITLFKNGQVILLSGGTTNMELARMLPPNLKITCFTPSLPVANQLLTKTNIDIIFIGGLISKDSKITIGGGAISMLSDIKVDLCFLGTNSIDVHNGLTEFDWEIVQLKKAMIRSAKQVVAPVISEKLNTSQRYKICDMEDVDILITELHPGDGELKDFNNKGIVIL